MAKDTTRCMSDRARRKNLEALYAQREACTDEQGWAALSRLILDLEREDYGVKQAKKQKAPTLTPEQQHAALTEQLATAPASVHWEVYQRILALHPEWAEADPEPGGELIPIKGGKR